MGSNFFPQKYKTETKAFQWMGKILFTIVQNFSNFYLNFSKKEKRSGDYVRKMFLDNKITSFFFWSKVLQMKPSLRGIYGSRICVPVSYHPCGAPSNPFIDDKFFVTLEKTKVWKQEPWWPKVKNIFKRAECLNTGEN